MNRALYIFDLDGTIALIDHRRPLLANKNDPDRWQRFESSCINDEPNWPVIRTMTRLIESGCEVWIFSGRTEKTRSETVRWLNVHTSFRGSYLDETLVMRRAGDSRPDDVIKQEFLDNMLLDDRDRLVAVFDDRQKVVEMWRRNGVPCFQVAPGDF